jgi:hypothetical protein
MHPVIRVLGRMLSLVGVSSPEDAAAKREAVDGPPSWRKPAPPKRAETADSETIPD